MSASNKLDVSLRRRSPRLSSPLQANVKTDTKPAQGPVAVKRSITVRKIAPRKTTAPSEHNKENTPRLSETDGSQQKKQRASDLVPIRTRRSSSTGEKEKKKAAMPSPILPSSPPPSRPQQPALDPEDEVWSQKVRRSYSRLSDKSFSSPDSKDNLFGFEKLHTPEVFQRVRHSKADLEGSGSLSGLNSFMSMLEAEDCGPAFPEQDPNIPGVAVVKEKKKRRRKVQQMNTTELDALAAEMNAVFEQAEEFDLVVE
ncbi:hypothetical protein JOB18_008442 [Solea senegalensis]|uniref:Sororin C-terminal region domain-containing protein n=1 Tax=Solea senegalensis TaxID=28829 RepID=A0AAV6R4M6_SOLSE|nr:sororin [Solea senegalensis]KAG7500088.1 hypothetical protein JOB18_008442 [Solea senegalensis]